MPTGHPVVEGDVSVEGVALWTLCTSRLSIDVCLVMMLNLVHVRQPQTDTRTQTNRRKSDLV